MANETGLDPAIIGKTYSGSTIVIDPEQTMIFAQATNETNPRYFDQDKGKRAVPPLFPVTLMVELGNKILSDHTLNIDISRMVHGEHEILYHRPLKLWDEVNISVLLESIDRKPSGDVLWAKNYGHVEKELVFEMRAGLFFRKPKKDEQPSKPKITTANHDVILSQEMIVAPDQSRRYATASGDDNPIHLDKDFAQFVGLPDIILHGLCTMAFATKAVIDELAGGDPAKIKKVRCRFSKPVFMGDTLTTEGWLLNEDETIQVIGFETKNQAGDRILTKGEAELIKS
ncbi:MAG: MaoC/PaaZ C-terminal domain-containing protein [Candidatus Hodarchaeales archaeon]|jgi:acyl dehydratase